MTRREELGLSALSAPHSVITNHFEEKKQNDVRERCADLLNGATSERFAQKIHEHGKPHLARAVR